MIFRFVLHFYVIFWKSTIFFEQFLSFLKNWHLNVSIYFFCVKFFWNHRSTAKRVFFHLPWTVFVVFKELVFARIFCVKFTWPTEATQKLDQLKLNGPHCTNLNITLLVAKRLSPWSYFNVYSSRGPEDYDYEGIWFKK